MGTTKEEVLLLANALNLDPALIEEYTREAEHQDGVEFWMQFDTALAVVEDMELYAANRSGD